MTDPKPPRRQALTEIDQIKRDFDALSEYVHAQEKAASQERAETLALVSSMHTALMKPSPGQSKSLLDRMAAVTINIESGERVTGVIIRLAAVLAALGVIAAFFKFNGGKP